MVSFPPHSWCLLVRTDFTDEEVWAQVVEEATRPSPEGYLAGVTVFDDRAADGASWETLRDAAIAVPGGRVRIGAVRGRPGHHRVG